MKKKAGKKMACGGKASKGRKMKEGGMVCRGMGAATRGGKFCKNG